MASSHKTRQKTACVCVFYQFDQAIEMMMDESGRALLARVVCRLTQSPARLDSDTFKACLVVVGPGARGKDLQLHINRATGVGATVKHARFCTTIHQVGKYVEVLLSGQVCWDAVKLASATIGVGTTLTGVGLSNRHLFTALAKEQARASVPPIVFDEHHCDRGQWRYTKDLRLLELSVERCGLVLSACIARHLPSRIVPRLYTPVHVDDAGVFLGSEEEEEEEEEKGEGVTCMGCIWDEVMPATVFGGRGGVHAELAKNARIGDFMRVVGEVLSVDHDKAMLFAIERSLLTPRIIGGVTSSYVGQFSDWVPYATFTAISTVLGPDEQDPIFFGLVCTAACMVVHAIGLSVRRQVKQKRSHSHSSAVTDMFSRYVHVVEACQTWEEFDRLVRRISTSLTINAAVAGDDATPAP